MRSELPIVAMLCLTAVVISGCGDRPATVSSGNQLADWRRAYAEAEKELTALRESHAAALAREVDLQEKIKAAQLATAKLQVEKQTLEEKFEEQEKRLGEIVEEVEATHKRHREEMESLRDEFEEYQRKYRLGLRLKAPGTELPKIVYDGTTFLSPVVIEATPAAIDIRHESGIARLDFALLSNEIRQRFGYHPGEAAEHLEKRSEKKADNLVTLRSVKDRQADFERDVALRIAYKAWQLKLTKADDAIRRKEARIASLKDQLSKARPGSFIVNRLKNDIVTFTRDLKYLRRDRRDFALTEPANPDAE